MNFDEAFKRLIGHEGGYVNDPNDPGGETKYGVSKRAYPDIDIKNLTLEGAKAIYLRDYWSPLRLDRLPITVRFDLFDTGVNAGLTRAIRLLQTAMGMPDTGRLLDAEIAKANAMDPQLLDKRFNGQRLLWLTTLKHWPSYARGWAARIARNLIDD